MVSDYVPARGDIVFLDFDPQKGSEQSGRRPAVVVSPKNYNEKVGLAVFCPITSVEKGYPFEVLLGKTMKTGGVILADQVKSLDWSVRNAQLSERLPIALLRQLMMKVRLLLLE